MGNVDIAAAVEQWQREGWVLLDELVDRADVEAAQAEIATLDPVTEVGPLRRPDQLDTPGFREAQFDGTTLFPLRNCPNLNRLFVHPAIVGFAQAALGETDLRLYQSRLWSKVGGHTNYEQSLHCDGNHSLVPIRSEPGFWFVEMFLYLSDVDEGNGAPKLVSRTDSTSESVTRGIRRREDAPALYAAEQSAPGRAGSLLAYRSDVWHRGTNIELGRDRHVAVIGYRPAHLEWVGFDAHPPLVSSPDFMRFAEASTPSELALFGFPTPGDAYWTDATLTAAQRMYPGLDLEPWRAACSS